MSRLVQIVGAGPLAGALLDLDPLTRDILVGLLTAQDSQDELLATLHRTTAEEVRRHRGRARERLAERLSTPA